MSKVVNSWWFGEIGIVKVFDEITKTDKFYIGRGSCFDQKLDEEFIKQGGYPFHPDIIK